MTESHIFHISLKWSISIQLKLWQLLSLFYTLLPFWSQILLTPEILLMIFSFPTLQQKNKSLFSRWWIKHKIYHVYAQIQEQNSGFQWPWLPCNRQGNNTSVLYFQYWGTFMWIKNDLQALNSLRPTRENLVVDHSAALHLDKQLFM